MSIETQDMLILLQDVAREVILPRFGFLAAEEISSKAHPMDLVTVADREAEVLITRELQARYPDALILGEEAAAENPSLLETYRVAEHSFTVDPVDGTKNFVANSPNFGVMVAELRQGVAVRSWIWLPQLEVAYVAERGAGAWRNGRRMADLRVPEDPTTWRMLAWERPRLDAALGSTTPSARSFGSCAVDYPQIAEGEYQAGFYYGTKPWDHAPGAVLLHEVGGVQCDTSGVAYDPRGQHTNLIAAGSAQVAATITPYL